MPAALTLQINGQSRTFPDLRSPTHLSRLVEQLGLKSDRIAVELNGEIVSRALWDQAEIVSHDRVEIVHFVGGGTPRA